MKPSVIIGVIVLLGAGVAWLIVTTASHYLASQTHTCSGHHADHWVIIKNNTVTPSRVQAPLCDTLTIINQDDRLRMMAFGPHNQHVAYDGISERVLSQGQSLHVTLNQAGTFTFHDHLQDGVNGQFVVAK